jgi:hypothetical protein
VNDQPHLRLATPHRDRASSDDQAMRLVLVMMNATVSTLMRSARTRQADRPDVAAHLRILSERVAGVTLDALRTWPAE